MPHSLTHSSFSFLFHSLSSSVPPAASSPSFPARPHVSRPPSLAVPPPVPGGARPSFLQLQPLLLLEEPLHGAPTQLGPPTGPPGFIWPLLSDRGEGKRTGEICLVGLTEDLCYSSAPTSKANSVIPLRLSTARVRGHPPSLPPSVCLPPVRACGEREG